MHKQLFIGPELPYNIEIGAMASSPDGNGVILFGGKTYSKGRYLTDILELKSNGQGWVGSWTKTTTQLKYAHGQHVVIPLVKDIDPCESNVYFTTTTYLG